jgi:nuclear transport factor 2 (NTF2) superfamily protein
MISELPEALVPPPAGARAGGGSHQRSATFFKNEERHNMPRPPLPPFAEQTAIEKVRLAEDGWNSRDPAKVALACTEDSRWRNRAEFITGRIVALLTRKWAHELDYGLIKEVWAFRDNRIADRFAHEYHDDSGNWFRACGNENWEFKPTG